MIRQDKISNNDPTPHSPLPNPLLTLIFIAAYTFLSAAAIFLIIRGVGAIAGLFFGSNSVIAAALSQLANARISIPVWIPLCGAIAVRAFRAPFAKRLNRNLQPKPVRTGFSIRYAVIVMTLSVVILLFAFAAAFLRTKVNGVFVHVSIGIIRMLLGSGML